MRISDWSSDVCSSDLSGTPGGRPLPLRGACLLVAAEHPVAPCLVYLHRIVLPIGRHVVDAAAVVDHTLDVAGGLRPGLLLLEPFALAPVGGRYEAAAPQIGRAHV